MSQVTILVAEDFARFREFVSRELQRRPEFRVVTISDGLAAVEKARELQPDLILLDVGLPALDGLAAARRIRLVSPSSKIVFLTQESSPDIVHEALKLGSQGYIHKTCAGHLLSTIDAILGDGQTIGRGASAASSKQRVDPDHHVLFYSDDATLLEVGEHFLRSALNAHDAVIAITPRSHMSHLLPRLKRWGGGVERAIEQGSFIHFDAEELASQVLSDGVARWQSSLVHTIASVAAATRRPRPRVAIFGECAGMLWAAGHIDRAIELEQLAVDAADTMSVRILCPYPLPPSYRDRGFKVACAHHSAIAIR